MHRMLQTSYYYTHHCLVSCKKCEEGAVQLAGGDSPHGEDSQYGRVEVCRGGNWGIVCGEGWDKREASVVCRQLGFPPQGTSLSQCKNKVVSCSELLAGSLARQQFQFNGGHEVLRNVECEGTELRLVNCSIQDPDNHTCRGKPAGVHCQRE